MMKTRRKAALLFDNSIPNKEWEKKINTWAIIIPLLQHLSENKAVLALKVAELNSDNGMTLLIQKLDTAFQSEIMLDDYSTYQNFTKIY